RALADDPADDFLVAAVLALVRGEHLDGPALVLGVAAVHAEEVAREERGLVAAGAGADLEEQIRVVVGILRHEMQRELPLLCGALRPERGRLLFAERTELPIVAPRELLGSGELFLELLVRGEIARDRLEPRVLARQLAEAVLVRDRLGLAQQVRELLVALGQRHQFAPYGFVHGSIVCWGAPPVRGVIGRLAAARDGNRPRASAALLDAPAPGKNCGLIVGQRCHEGQGTEPRGSAAAV